MTFFLQNKINKTKLNKKGVPGYWTEVFFFFLQINPTENEFQLLEIGHVYRVMIKSVVPNVFWNNWLILDLQVLQIPSLNHMMVIKGLS